MPALTGPRRKPPSIMDKKNAKAAQQKKQRPCCSEPKPEEQDGAIVCQNCFVQVGDANIVSEVMFGEDARGGAVLQGGTVQAGQRHAHASAPGMNRLGGGGERNAGQNAAGTAKRVLSKFDKLGINDKLKGQVVSLFCLASAGNFSAGRRTDETVGACLYAICRRDKENTVLLIDISEILAINVFRLGEVYKALCRDLFLDNADSMTGSNMAVGDQRKIEIESLIMKYCKKLGFGGDTKRVAEDAVKILKRMKRDWMVTGRHPAGLCGACIIYAARMNNFRRTKREVVYVAKIADATIAKRMDEFKRTRASLLTVDDFRAKGHLLKTNHLPPAMAESVLNKQKFEEKKRKRQADNAAIEASRGASAEIIEVNENNSSATNREGPAANATPDPNETNEQGPSKRQKTTNGAPATPAATQQEPRLDGDGFAIPGIPASMAKDQNQSDDAPVVKRRGRRKRPPMEPVSDTDLMVESQLEQEIDEALRSEEVTDRLYEAQVQHDKEISEKRTQERERKEAAAMAEEQGKEVQPDDQSVISEAQTSAATPEIVTDDMLEAEFANDPEVLNCLLPEREQRLKEQIWVAENEDWMRQQVHKEIISKVNKDTGTSGSKGKRGRKSKMGDNSSLTEANTPIENAADATGAMLRKRAPKGFSQHINYDALKKAYHQNSPSTASTSRAGSATPSVADTEASRYSESPAPPNGRPRTPPATQAQGQGAGSPGNVQSETGAQAPMSPPITQAQATQGANDEDDEDDGTGDPSDYVHDYNEELDYGSDDEQPTGWLNPDEDDDREDFDEDYGAPLSRQAMDPDDDY